MVLRSSEFLDLLMHHSAVMGKGGGAFYVYFGNIGPACINVHFVAGRPT